MWQEKFTINKFSQPRAIVVAYACIDNITEHENYDYWFSKKTKEVVTLQKTPFKFIKDAAKAVLVVSSKNIIEKRTKIDELDQNLDSDRAVLGYLQNELPGVNEREFIIEYHFDKEDVIIKIARKQIVMELIKSIPHIQVVHIVLSNINQSNVNDQISISTSDLSATDNSESYKNEVVQASLSYLTQSWHKIILNEELHAIATSHYELSKVKALSYSMTLYLLAFCTISLLLNQYIGNLILQQSEKINKIGSSKAEVDIIQAKINAVGSIAQKCGLNEKTYFATLCDQIAATIPENVSLTGLEVFPQKALQNEDSLQQFERKKIFISGHCISANAYTTWVKLLGNLSIVKEVEQSKYNHQAEESRNKFELLIELK